jgi:hypothetical protein
LRADATGATLGDVPRRPPYERPGQAERLTVAGVRWRFALALALAAAGMLIALAVLAALS